MLTSAFRHILRKLNGDDLPPQRAVWTYDLKPILAATSTGDLEELERFLNKYETKSIIELTRSMGTGVTVLHRAAKKGDTGVAGLLLDYGANIHEKDIWGTTPLHAAAAEGQKNMILFLLKRGASINQPDDAGWTPLSAAAFKGHKETVELLLDQKANVKAGNLLGFTALHSALGHAATMKLLMERGAGIDAQDARGATPLMSACGMSPGPSRLRSVALLLEQGAALDPAGKDGLTARMIAERNDAQDVVALIAQEETRRRESHFKLVADVRVRRLRLKQKEAR